MSESARTFFYRNPNAEIRGPVTEEELHQLYLKEVIGRATRLRSANSTKWHRFRPGRFGWEDNSPPTPETPSPLPHKRKARPRPRGKMEEGEKKLDWNLVVMGLAWISVFISALVVTRHLAEGSGSLFSRFGPFVGTGLISWLVIRFVPRPHRYWARPASLAVLALLVIVAVMNRPATWEAARRQAMTDKIKAEARKQIIEKGYYDGSVEQALGNLASAQKGLSGSDTLSQLNQELQRDLQAFRNQVKMSEAVEKTCPDFNPTTLQSLNDLEARQATIQKLRDTQVEVVETLQSFDDHCRKALAAEKPGETQISEMVSGARLGGHLDLVQSIWKLKVQLCDDHLARLAFLERKWGQWSVKEDKLAFDDSAALNGYNVLLTALQKDVADMKNIQAQIFQ